MRASCTGTSQNGSPSRSDANSGGARRSSRSSGISRPITAWIAATLKGEQGDRLHAVLCAAGYNIKWLLRMIAKKGIAFLRQLYLRLCALARMPRKWLQLMRAWQQLCSADHLRSLR